MRFLWDHSRIRYRRAGVGHWAVEYDGKPMGIVRHSTAVRSTWVYLPAGMTEWIGHHSTRADAADNLISYMRPSAAWLGPPVRA